MIVCDTGPLVAAALSNDKDHAACVDLLTSLHEAGTELLIPAPVVAEVGYLLAREAGARVEALFLRSLADGDFGVIDLMSEDYARMADLVITYGDLPLGTTDAAVVAVAERLIIRADDSVLPVSTDCTAFLTAARALSASMAPGSARPHRRRSATRSAYSLACSWANRANMPPWSSMP